MMVSEQKHALQVNGGALSSASSSQSVTAARTSIGVNHAASALAAATTTVTTTTTTAAAVTDPKTTSSGGNLVDATASLSQSMELSFATASSMAASADPIAAAAAAAAVGLTDPNSASALGEAMAFAALPFDENLMNMPNGSAANFFIDTAMLAQQIAAVVADEKKLSDVSIVCVCVQLNPLEHVPIDRKSYAFLPPEYYGFNATTDADRDECGRPCDQRDGNVNDCGHDVFFDVANDAIGAATRADDACTFTADVAAPGVIPTAPRAATLT